MFSRDNNSLGLPRLSARPDRHQIGGSACDGPAHFLRIVSHEDGDDGEDHSKIRITSVVGPPGGLQATSPGVVGGGRRWIGVGVLRGHGG